MDLVKFTEEIILSIVEEPELVAVKEFPTENEKEMLIQVLIHNDDMSKVIGKNGKVINAVRTIIQASSYLKENKTIKINVDSI